MMTRDKLAAVALVALLGAVVIIRPGSGETHPLDACEAAGGIAVQGHREHYVCIDQGAIIETERNAA